MNENLRKQILTIRNIGLTSMFDVTMVHRLANDSSFYDLVCYLEEHRKEYMHFILTGEEKFSDRSWAYDGGRNPYNLVLEDHYSSSHAKILVQTWYCHMGTKRHENMQFLIKTIGFHPSGRALKQPGYVETMRFYAPAYSHTPYVISRKFTREGAAVSVVIELEINPSSIE